MLAAIFSDTPTHLPLARRREDDFAGPTMYLKLREKESLTVGRKFRSFGGEEPFPLLPMLPLHQPHETLEATPMPKYHEFFSRREQR